MVRCGPFTKVNRCIAEGRKSFLARYASIESGEECERWAPVVSAMIDGEATPQQVVDARPHLRNCSACRAVMREAERQSRSLAVLFPAGLGVGAGAAEGGQAAPAPDAGGLITRIYEAVASALQERAVASAIKVQAALDAATAGKVAAVAASAAAVAGGGAAVVDQAVDARDARPREPVAHRAPVAADDAARAAAERKRAARPSASGSGSAGSAPRRSAQAREFGRPASASSSGSRQVKREFSNGRQPAATAASSTSAGSSSASRSEPVRPAGQVDREFGP